MSSEERCEHDMVKEYCAICLQHKLGDEEDNSNAIFKGLLNKEVPRK